IGDITHTKPNSTIIFTYDESLMSYCFENNISFAVIVQSIKEGLYCNALRAKYIICQNNLAKAMQTVAQNYLFDSKVLVIIHSNDDLEAIAKDEIDGVIYDNVLA
ncbi:MAG: hypothetical protein WC149_02340, partial [Arcobacteraceae bacterium]